MTLVAERDALAVAIASPPRRAAPRRRAARASGCAASDSDGSNGVSRRGAASTRMMRAQRGSIERKSAASARLASSAMAPAISTPVGPPPITTKVSSRAPLVGVVLVLGALEGEQDAAAQIGRVVDGLQARARTPPSRRGRNRRAARRSRAPDSRRECAGRRRSPPCARCRRPSPRPSMTLTLRWPRRMLRIGEAMSAGDSPAVAT